MKNSRMPTRKIIGSQVTRMLVHRLFSIFGHVLDADFVIEQLLVHLLAHDADGDLLACGRRADLAARFHRRT